MNYIFLLKCISLIIQFACFFGGGGDRIKLSLEYKPSPFYTSDKKPLLDDRNLKYGAGIMLKYIQSIRDICRFLKSINIFNLINIF